MAITPTPPTPAAIRDTVRNMAPGDPQAVYGGLRRLATEAAFVTLGTSDLAVEGARNLGRRTTSLPGEVARTIGDLPDRLRVELDDLADRGRLMTARVQGDDVRQQTIESDRMARRKRNTGARPGGRSKSGPGTGRPRAKVGASGPAKAKSKSKSDAKPRRKAGAKSVAKAAVPPPAQANPAPANPANPAPMNLVNPAPVNPANPANR